MQSDDILLNKAAIIERCVRRVLEEYQKDNSLSSFTYMDAMMLNIERACQATIDVAMHLCAKRHLGIPQGSADAFKLLEINQIISPELCQKMRQMSSFRNVAIHEYQVLDKEIVKAIAQGRYQDFIEFMRVLGVKIEP